MTDRADDSVSTTLRQCLYRRRKEACPSELICTVQEEMHMQGNDLKSNLKIPIILAPMAVDRKPHNVSSSAMATSWLDRRLVTVLYAAHRRSRQHMTAMTLGIASLSGVGVFLYPSVVRVESAAGEFVTAALATIVSLLTAVALYNVMTRLPS